MKVTIVAASILAIAGLSVGALAADAPLSPRPGEVRAMAIALSNATAVAELHREGWLEAQGQLLSTGDFPELFQAVGRAWTAKDVPANRFAIPSIHERTGHQVSSDNPFGVLGPGDLVTSGIPQQTWLRPADLSEWIFAGKDVTGLVAAGSLKR